MKTGILYVVFNESIRSPETNERLYKIGITRNSVHDRYYGLGLKMPGKFETLFAYKLEDYAKAEQLIHGILRNYRENGEWFNISQKELDLIKANCEVMGGKLVTDEFEEGIEAELSVTDNKVRRPKSIVNPLNKPLHGNDSADTIIEFADRCIIVKIKQETVDNAGSVYEAVRHCWRNKKEKAEQADYVLAVVKGVVEGVFEPTLWYHANSENVKKYGGYDVRRDRIAFVGKEADADAQRRYLHKYIPEWFMRPGPGPFLYTY